MNEIIKDLQGYPLQDVIVIAKYYNVDKNLPIDKFLNSIASSIIKKGAMPNVKLNISYKGITDLNDYFSKYSGDIEDIIELDCSNNKLTSLQGCPPNVKNLNCSNNLLTTLEGCPPGVTFLDASSNRLISLRGTPKNLQFFSIMNNPVLVDTIFKSGNFVEELQFVPKFHPLLEKLFEKACVENRDDIAIEIAKYATDKKSLMKIAIRYHNKKMIKTLRNLGELLPLQVFDIENNDTSKITVKLREMGVPLHNQSGYVFVKQGVPNTRQGVIKQHYKIHLQPKQGKKEEVVTKLVELFSGETANYISTWKYSELDPQQLLEMSSGGNLNKLFPSIVIYPSENGDDYKGNTEIVLENILKTFPDADELGFNLTPRYNISVNSLVYYAGGDGDFKVENPELFDEKLELYKEQLPLLVSQEFIPQKIIQTRKRSYTTRKSPQKRFKN